MSLIEKAFHEEQPVISAHDFGAILRMFFLGDVSGQRAIGAVETMLTLNNNGQAYSLSAAERQQLVNIKQSYDTKLLRAQQDHLDKIHSVMILAAHGRDVYLSEQELVNIVGF